MNRLSLKHLLDSAKVESSALKGEDRPISGITADSRAVEPGWLYACMPVESQDTHRFLPQAAEKGASAALVFTNEGFEKAVQLGMAAVLVDKTQLMAAASRLAAEVFGRPIDKLNMLAVTGTNGKSTTVSIVRDAINNMGGSAASLGTVGLTGKDWTTPVPNTTPFPVETMSLFADAAARDIGTVAMEVSSHSLVERRIDALTFDAAVFTNLSQDHLDFHQTMEEYEGAKRLLFTEFADRSVAAGRQFRSAINIGDPVGRRWALELDCPVMTFGDSDADLSMAVLEAGFSSIRLAFTYNEQELEQTVPLGGRFNCENTESALAGLLVMGYGFEASVNALSSVRQVPGRFEPIENDRGISVIVDFAHTDDAITALLKSVRELNPRRIITLFGCGGDRDRRKRPLMAAAASRDSDLVIVTADNPRTEDLNQILSDTEAGLDPSVEHLTIADRPEAIHRAVELAEPGDVVVLAGKGHEDYQIIGREKIHMDDREIAREAVRR